MLFFIVSCESSDDLSLNDNDTSNEPPTETDLPVIIYTDIDPDFNGNNNSPMYELDLDNDELPDFILSGVDENGWEGLTIASRSDSENGILSIAPWYIYSVPLNEGKKIFRHSLYTNGEYYHANSIISSIDCFEKNNSDFCGYDWSSQNDKYLGLQIEIEGQIHYGWARMEVINPGKWVLKDYAYNATPDSPILAGQKK